MGDKNCTGTYEKALSDAAEMSRHKIIASMQPRWDNGENSSARENSSGVLRGMGRLK